MIIEKKSQILNKDLKKNSVLCLVVTYNGGKTIKETIKSIARQSKTPDKILLIDNASSDGTINIIRSLNIQNLELIILDSNIGVAGAYNLGIDTATKQNFKWLWIFDQDTICMEDCLDHLLDPVIEGIEEIQKLAALCPTVKSKSFPEINLPSYKWNGKRFLNIIADNTEELIPVHSSITSGTLYQVKVLQKIRGFREDYFIDFVDHECHMRFNKAGYKMFWVHKASIFHELGTAKKDSNGEIMFTHKPWRYYYMGRNMTDGYIKLGGLPSMWAFWSDAMKQFKRLRKVNGNMGISFCFFIRGIFDAFIKNFGSLKSNTFMFSGKSKIQ